MAIIDPTKEYKKLQDENQTAINYDNLNAYSDNMGQRWIIPQEQQFDELTQEKPSQFIQQTLAPQGCIKAWTATDKEKPSQFTLNLRFDDTTTANAYKHKYCEHKTHVSGDGKTIFLTQEVIAAHLQQLNITDFNQTNPIPIAKALQQEYHQQTSINTTALKFFNNRDNKLSSTDTDATEQTAAIPKDPKI